MSISSISLNNVRQEYTLHTQDISGSGGLESPYLLIPLSFSFIPYRQGEKYPYSEFGINHVYAELSLTPQNVKALSISLPLQYNIYQPSTYNMGLRFPLTREALYYIEKYRNGNLTGHLLFNLQIAKYESFPVAQGVASTYPKYISGFENSQGHTTFSIEQSQWVNKILPALGHKTATLIELPTASVILPAEYTHSMAELEESRKYFLTGDYDKVVGHCRSAIEPFKKDLPALRTSITSRSEHDWIKKNLVATCDYVDTIMNATYTITNKSHHPPSIGNFGRSEAEIILNMTVLILTYIGKIKPDHDV
jgi:hypothetical protein